MRTAPSTDHRSDRNTASLPLHQWRSPERYYAAYLTWDLFDDLVLVMHWGGRSSRRSGGKTVPVESLEAGARLLDALHRRRQMRGYEPLI